MKRLAGFALSLIVAWLCAVTVAGPALAAPGPEVAAMYDYDGQHHPPALSDTTSERGPPAIAYDYTAPHLAVVAARYGSLACPRTATSPTCTDYDHPVQLVQVAGGPGTTLTEACARESKTRADLRARCAAKTRKLDNVDDLPCNCFVAGPKVQTAEGEKSIEDVEVGDEVWAKDLETGDSHLRRVTALFQKQADHVMTVTVADGATVTVTDEHPFYVVGVGWVMSGDLRVGDRLAQRNGDSTTIASIEVSPVDATVYNFTVEGDHNYYVTEAQLLVHNCSYVDLTRPGSIRNVGTDLSHTDFADNLTGAGWASRMSKDGSVQILERGGAKYTLRSHADSYAGWTAEFFPAGSSSATLKIRLGYTP